MQASRAARLLRQLLSETKNLSHVLLTSDF